MTGVGVVLTRGDFSGEPRKFARPTDDGVELGRLVDAANADVALFPFNVAMCVETEADRRRLVEIVRANAARGLRTVMYFVHDTSAVVDLGQPDAVVLRTSMQASIAYPGDWPMPVAVADPWRRRPWEPAHWAARPTVGFMGSVDVEQTRSFLARDGQAPVPAGFVARDVDAEPLVFGTPISIGGVLRRRALAGLAASRSVDPSIVVRDRYHAHFPEAEQRWMREQYAAHLESSPYVLCVRGVGNYSIRMFETMAMGRVPVLLETDLVLPCADMVDWDAIAVRVPLADIDRIDEHVAAAHAAGGPAGLLSRQRAARQAWLDYLSVPAFARYVATVILAQDRNRSGSTHG